MEVKVRILASAFGAARSHLDVEHLQASEAEQQGHSGACMRTARQRPTVT